MSRGLFVTIAVVGTIVGAIIVAAAMFVSIQNKAITMEEQINESASAIEVQEKRRVDLVYNLADTIMQYDKHEKDTLTQLTEARSQASQGKVEEARLAINAVAEAYPELKSIENYRMLMKELSVTENLIAEYRNNFNIQVRAYNKHIRTFPNSFFLNLAGYERINTTYLEYDAPEDAPQDLFNRGD